MKIKEHLKIKSKLFIHIINHSLDASDFNLKKLTNLLDSQKHDKSREGSSNCSSANSPPNEI